MGNLSGNGANALTVNGRQVAYQGIGNIRKDLTTAQAFHATANDGYQKYFLESTDHKERVVVWADKLDFSFEKQRTVPQVTLGGKPFVMVAKDDENTSIVGGFVEGMEEGVSGVASATLGAANGLITNAGAASVMALAGGTTLALFRGVAADSLVGTARALATPALRAIGLLVAVVAGGAAVVGGIKGAVDAADRRHDDTGLAEAIEPLPLSTSNPDPSSPGTLSVDPGSASGQSGDASGSNPVSVNSIRMNGRVFRREADMLAFQPFMTSKGNPQ